MMGRSSGTGFSCNKGEEGEKRMVHKPVFEITSLLEQLNDRILSIDSLQGLLVFLLCALIIFKLAGEVRKMLRWFIFLILFMEIGHAAAQTELGQSIPWMGQIFRPGVPHYMGLGDRYYSQILHVAVPWNYAYGRTLTVFIAERQMRYVKI